MCQTIAATPSRHPETPVDREKRLALLAAMPSMRQFARSLCRDADRAEDLVQDTLVRALGALDRFDPSTCLNAWLYTIMRNLFRSQYRKRRRMVEDPDGVYADRLCTPPTQSAGLELDDFRRMLARISQEQRDAVMMVGAAGMTYEDAAEASGVPIGTIKSRVNRARDRLSALLGVAGIEDLGPDKMTRAALQIAA